MFLDLWHIRQPMTPERWARLVVLLLEKPGATPPTVNDVLGRLTGDKLKKALALLLDVPTAWVNRHFNAVGAVQVIGEFLQMDMAKEAHKMRVSTKAQQILRKAGNGPYK